MASMVDRSQPKAVRESDVGLSGRPASAPSRGFGGVHLRGKQLDYGCSQAVSVVGVRCAASGGRRPPW
jgi:hypothetical protein